MDRFETRFFAFRALLVPMIFLLSIAIILLPNDLTLFFWLLVLGLEFAGLDYRRVRRLLHREVQVEADV
jgi:hypothetical protein